ncbi:MAG: pirin family protein [candidate division WOR-3 bacterium]|nr:MAG: pirin family protein [candidate division WOR-3 bacterium]
MSVRQIRREYRAQPTLEGAGVRLSRVFGYHQVPDFDPFLLLDHFGSDNPDDYMAGFPWHPHRGIETVTYMIAGEVEHGDSIGNKGVIRSGDVQWMTAGGGILHQEMPQRYEGTMNGLQLWVNLPASEKMTDPRYRDVLAGQIPALDVADGVRVKVLSGEVDGRSGPVHDLVVSTEYLDVELEPGRTFAHPVAPGWTVFGYVRAGSASMAPSAEQETRARTAALFADGDSVRITAGSQGASFVLVSGTPLGEKVAWGGPIVMNTEKELDLAFRELEQGTFIKHGQRE